MTKHLIASFVALGLLAGPAAAATTTKAPTEKAKVHKSHVKSKTNVKDDQSKTKAKYPTPQFSRAARRFPMPPRAGRHPALPGR
jgi:hypothetical protein